MSIDGVVMAVRNATHQQVLGYPVSVLIGIDESAATALRRLSIESVLDLAASSLFRTAAALVGASSAPWFDPHAGIPRDLVAPEDLDGVYDLAALPIGALRGVGPARATELSALGLATVGRCAAWSPYVTAADILAAATGSAVPDDHAEPDTADLTPTNRRYSTERVRYEVLVAESAGQTRSEAADLRELETAGALTIDGSAPGYTVPVLGALLEYDQEWFTEGVALGHLLHSVALAPGESTRIALIDWTRRTAGSQTQQTSQSEQLESDLSRARAIKEVTDAVLKETTDGFSESWGIGGGAQVGTGGGLGANLSGSGMPMAAAVGSSEGFGLSGSYGRSSASLTGTRRLDVTMRQNIDDHTHQSATSVRNRWATVVREATQEEREHVSTRAVTNFNHMHALSLHYYEVVRIYRVLTRLARITRLIHVPFGVFTFRGTDVAVRHRRVIAAAALSPAIRAAALLPSDATALTAELRVEPWTLSTTVVPDPQHQLTTIMTSTTSADPVMTIGAGRTFSRLLLESTTAPGWVVLNIDAVILRSPGHPDVSLPVARDGANAYIDVSVPAFTEWLARGGDLLAHRPASGTTAGTLGAGLSGSWSDSYLPGGLARTLTWTLAAPANDPFPLLRATPTLRLGEFVEHLEQNALHYSQAIWRSLPASAYAAVLARHGYQGRSLVDRVDPNPVAITDNYVVFKMPVDEKAPDEAWAQFLDRYDLDGDHTVQESFLPLPSGGVFAEAVLGRANSAERLDLSRFWNWQDSPIPITAPEIAPITTGSRAQDENLAGNPLEEAVLRLIAAPELPDPQSLTAALTALSTASVFQNLSGLAGTQDLAKAYATLAMDGAKHAAEQAGKNAATGASLAGSLLGGTGAGTGATGQGEGAKAPPTVSNLGAIRNAAQEIDRKEAAVTGGTGGGSGGTGTGSGGGSGGAGGGSVGGGGGPRPVPPTIEKQVITGSGTGSGTGRPSSVRTVAVDPSRLTIAGTQRGGGFDGVLTLGFAKASGPGASESEVTTVLDVVGGVATQRVSLAPGLYSVRPRMVPSAASAQLLRGLTNRVVAGLDIEALNRILDADLADDVGALAQGTVVTVATDAEAILFTLEAEVAERKDLVVHLKTDASLGFSVEAGVGLKFDSSKLEQFGRALGRVLKGTRLSALRAVLSAFSITTNWDQKLDAGVKTAADLQLTVIPAYLNRLALTRKT